MKEHDRTRVVLSNCELIRSRTRFDADLSATQITKLKCAILFVNAFWSGPSISALRDLADTIYDLDPIGAIDLVVCDTDAVPKISETDWKLETTGGIGEIAWVCNGEVFARHHAHEKQNIRDTTRKHLYCCDQV